MPYGIRLHIPPTSCHPLAAQQQPYNKNKNNNKKPKPGKATQKTFVNEKRWRHFWKTKKSGE